MKNLPSFLSVRRAHCEPHPLLIPSSCNTVAPLTNGAPATATQTAHLRPDALPCVPTVRGRILRCRVERKHSASQSTEPSPAGRCLALHRSCLVSLVSLNSSHSTVAGVGGGARFVRGAARGGCCLRYARRRSTACRRRCVALRWVCIWCRGWRAWIASGQVPRAGR